MLYRLHFRLFSQWVHGTTGTDVHLLTPVIAHGKKGHIFAVTDSTFWHLGPSKFYYKTFYRAIKPTILRELPSKSIGKCARNISHLRLILSHICHGLCHRVYGVIVATHRKLPALQDKVLDPISFGWDEYVSS
jgi:hypothetical protein